MMRCDIIRLALAALSAGAVLMAVGCSDKNSSTSANAPVSSVEEQTSSVEPEDKNAFYAEVLAVETDFGGILVMPEDSTLPPELIVHSDNMPALKAGDRIKVAHSGQIALSYPGQIFGADITVTDK